MWTNCGRIRAYSHIGNTSIVSDELLAWYTLYWGAKIRSQRERNRIESMKLRRAKEFDRLSTHNNTFKPFNAVRFMLAYMPCLALPYSINMFYALRIYHFYIQVMYNIVTQQLAFNTFESFFGIIRFAVWWQLCALHQHRMSCDKLLFRCSGFGWLSTTVCVCVEI